MGYLLGDFWELRYFLGLGKVDLRRLSGQETAEGSWNFVSGKESTEGELRFKNCCVGCGGEERFAQGMWLTIVDFLSCNL
jgi:hypothetical protein